MSDYPTGKSTLKERASSSRLDREDNPQQERTPKTYQSQDRYHRQKPKAEPQQSSASAEEAMDLQGLGKALSREKKMAPTQANSPGLLSHPRMQTPDACSSNVETTARITHLRSQQADLWPAESNLDTSTTSSRTPQEYTSKREIDPDTLACLEGSKSHPSHSFHGEKAEEGPSYFDCFNLTLSQSAGDKHEQHEHSNIEGIKSAPQNLGEESQSDRQSKRSGCNPNRHYNVQRESPLVSAKLSSDFTLTRRNIKAPSPFLSEEQTAGFTHTGSGVQAPSPFFLQSQAANFTANESKSGPHDHESLSHGFLSNPNCIAGSSSQQKEFLNFNRNHGGAFQAGSHVDSYSQSTELTSTRQGNTHEARSPLDYNSPLESSSGNQLGSFQTGSLAGSSKHPQLGTNRFANLQDVEYERSQNSPASSHHTTQSGYKPAHLRYAQAQQNESFQADESRDSAPTTPPRPLEYGQRFEAAGPRDYSGLLNTPHHPGKDGHGFESSRRMQSFQPNHHNERSQSARGFYSPTPYRKRPLPPVPQRARVEKRDGTPLGQVSRVAQNELQQGRENPRNIFGGRGKVVQGLKTPQLRKTKSSFYDSKESQASHQSRPLTPDVNFPREPPPVPPSLPRIRTGTNHLANTTGVDCLAGISEQSAATSVVICEFLRQKGVEGFIKSLSRSNVQDIVANLKELDAKIDWLGDSLWKGSSEARRLFMDQNNESIKLVYYRMIRNLTYMSFDMDLMARTKGHQRCIKAIRTEMMAIINSIVEHLVILVRSMEPYVGTSIIGNQRAGKGEILVTRFRRCGQEWDDLKKSARNDVKDSKPQSPIMPGFI